VAGTIDAPRVNGKAFEWGSIRIKLVSQEIIGITALDFGQKRERVALYGTGRSRAPIGFTSGKYSTENGKMTIWSHTYRDLIEELASRAPDKTSYGDVTFNIFAHLEEPGEKPLRHELYECAITSESTSYQEGTEPLKQDIGLFIMYVKTNGKTLFNNSQKRY
jgi:hypothetical protein